ncbi:MAG TPA: hypothetical protein VG146_21415 [Verrucomicrobiae bacterium]|nr:hypothetical protein [Verrucomicrobiae bacterium]
MDTTATTGVKARVPEGYRAIPISQSDQNAALRICVLVRQTPDPVAGHFLLLRDLHDALVYLGALVDAAGQVREWLELWVQNVDGLEASLPAYREAFSNFSLDARWTEQAKAFRELAGPNCLWTGWEETHPLPSFLDLAQGNPLHPAGPEGPWELCRQDDLLRAAGLPAFSTSLFRYLYQPSAGSATHFIPVTAGAPENGATRPLREAVATMEQHLSLNPQGGLMLALGFSPIPFEEYVDLLGGKAWGGIEHGRKRLQLNGVYGGLADWEQGQQESAHLFLGPQGRAGRLIETFHLKLQLLVDAMRETRAFVQKQQLPLLNLTCESFRVSLKEPGAGLPILWTAHCALVRPGSAFALPVETSDFRYFIRARSGGASIYLPEGLSAPLQGSASARIRQVLPPDQGRTIVEGTLVLQERLAISPHDLLWIRLPLASGRQDLYGHLYAAEALAQGEVRFRTIPQQLPPGVVENLKAAEGVSFARAPFEVVPLLSSPCDLYALGVLGVRTLLVDGENTLPIALDELLSLARQAATEHQPNLALGARIRAILERDTRYAESLGPHRLAAAGPDAKPLAQVIPMDLWCDSLAVVASLFPGLGPDSVCRDFGDVAALALEAVFDRPMAALENLLLRSRSLVVIDWTFNQEIRDTIETFLQRI